MRRGIVAKLFDGCQAIQRRLHDASLDAPPSPVNHANLAKALAYRGFNVCLDHRRDVAWGERVQIDLIFDGYTMRIVVHAERQTAAIDA